MDSNGGGLSGHGEIQVQEEELEAGGRRQDSVTVSITSAASKDNSVKVTVKDLIMKRFTPQENGGVRCKFCPKFLKVSNITGIQRHLESQHKKEYSKFQEEKEALSRNDSQNKKKQQKRDNEQTDVGPKMKQTKFAWKVVDKDLQERWDNALVDYAADSFSSYRQLSSESFRKLISVANKIIHVKDTSTLSRHMRKKAKKILNQIVGQICKEKSSLQSVAFTTDVWTSITGDSYISLTVHYIDR